jgi:hypothetical protein
VDPVPGEEGWRVVQAQVLSVYLGCIKAADQREQVGHGTCLFTSLHHCPQQQRMLPAGQ